MQKNIEKREKAIQAAEAWCRGLEIPFPIAMQASSPLQGELENFLHSQPILIGTTAEALLGVRLGLIERAHDLVQDASSGLEAYIHGMIHRLEGDFWNANYWFRAAGKPIVSQVASVAGEKGLLDPFDPAKLVGRLERLPKSSKTQTNPSSETSPELDAIRGDLELEWWAVWSQVVFALS
ncbi:hypothetical protein SH449x_004644 [Pirellulaceae bacterium SH449]